MSIRSSEAQRTGARTGSRGGETPGAASSTLLAAAVLSACLFAGCTTVGPDYQAPDLSLPEVWTGEIKRELERADEEALADWWLLVGDETLTTLVEEALTGNLDLRQTLSRIEQARAVRAQARGRQRPEALIEAEVAGARTTETGAFQAPADNPTDRYGLGVAAGWELDVFGRLRRAVEATEADYQASIEDYRSVRVALAAEVANEYIVLRTLLARIEVAKRNVERQRQAMDIAQRRYDVGVTSKLDVSQAAYTLASSESRIPRFQAEIELSRNRLSLLLGRYPGELDETLSRKTRRPTLEVLPDLGLPQNLLRRRPDVRRQERRLAAQTARIGVAVGELYPRFNLLGLFGFSTITAGDLLEGSSRTWSAGLPVTWNLFSGGRLRARVREQEARTRTALLAYQETVLTAVTEVESTLAFAAKTVEYRTAVERAVEATQEAGEQVWSQYRQGVVDFQRVIDVERTLLEREDELVVIEGVLARSLVQLYRSLGGGWAENDPLLVAIEAGQES